MSWFLPNYFESSFNKATAYTHTALISPSGYESFNSSCYAPGKQVQLSWTGLGESTGWICCGKQTPLCKWQSWLLSLLSFLKPRKGLWVRLSDFLWISVVKTQAYGVERGSTPIACFLNAPNPPVSNTRLMCQRHRKQGMKWAKE